MARKKSAGLTDGELRLMDVIWEKGAATVSEVVEALTESPPLHYSTVLTTLRVLETKGYLEHVKAGRAFIYKPLVQKDDARDNAVTHLLRRFFDGSPEALMLNLVRKKKIAPEEFARVQKRIADAVQDASKEGDPVVNNILTALMNGAVGSAALALVVSVALKLIPRNSLNAATRYCIWWAVLIATVAMPSSYLQGRPPRIQQSVTSLPVTQAPPASPDDMMVRTEIASPGNAPSAPRFTFPIEIPAGPWPARIAMAWLAISALLLIRLFISAATLERRKARANEAPQFLKARIAGSHRPIRIGLSREISIPLVSGPRRPTILLPAKLLKELAEPELKQIVIHEAAHLARHDDYALLIQRVIQALFAIHPVVAFACARIDLEREIACDDFVIAATGNSLPYASCLARVVELSGGVRALPLAAAAVEDRSHLARRVEMLLDTTRQAGTRLLRFRLGVAAICIAVFAWGAEQTPHLLAFARPLPSPLASAFTPAPLNLP